MSDFDDSFIIDTIKELTGIRLKYFIYMLEKEMGENKKIYKVSLKHYKELDSDIEEIFYLVEYHGGKLTIGLDEYKEWKKKYPIEQVILG